MQEHIINKYFRPGRLPHIWCPGCGNGIILGSIAKAIDKLGLDQDTTSIVSGIGCSSRSSGYLDFNTVHTAHGRALTFATGIKLAKPDLNVIVCTGDGDATAIGGNHFIHAARRNIDLTVILFNNNIYGMTGGQYSPMTPPNSKATTAPYGTIEPAFDIVGLAKGAGATFVARTTTYHVQQMVDIISQAIKHPGFALVEVITSCPISFGRQNKLGEAPQMMTWYKNNAVMVGPAWDRLSEEDKQVKMPIGLLSKTEGVPEYTAQYDKLIERATGGKK